MHRCLQLADLGAGATAPNPMVGAVLVHEDRIIGEGYHQRFGQAHAEVNCLNSVSEADRKFIEQAVLYVSLEPCSHYGKTPPCADLIVEHKIPQVVIGSPDPFPKVNGAGIRKLREAGVFVQTGILQEKCDEMNKRFMVFHLQKRPYIILKWAEKNGVIGSLKERLLISNSLSNRLVHKWRSEEAAIMVGTNTALYDNPQLSNRHWNKSDDRSWSPLYKPTRIIIDLTLRLPHTLNVFDKSVPTVIINYQRDGGDHNLLFVQIDRDREVPVQICEKLYELNLQSVIIEGGRQLLQTFIDAQLWDEARVITGSGTLSFKDASQLVLAPVLLNALPGKKCMLRDDMVAYYINKNSLSINKYPEA